MQFDDFVQIGGYCVLAAHFLLTPLVEVFGVVTEWRCIERCMHLLVQLFRSIIPDDGFWHLELGGLLAGLKDFEHDELGLGN